MRRTPFPTLGLLLACTLAACATGSALAPAGVEAPREPSPVLVGAVLSVTDGDTIRVQLDSGPITVRFDSVDAPEKSQPWGREAYAALAHRLNRQVVALEVREQDQYERLVAMVYLGDENINRWLVQQGHAWAYRQYLSDASYCTLEASARAARLGLWGLPAAGWYAPWEWRRVQRRAGGFTDFSNETAQRCVEAMRR